MKTRWKSLRDKYVRHDKMEETPTWEYWNDLGFLQSHINHKKNVKKLMHKSSLNTGSEISLPSTSTAIPSATQSTNIMQSSSADCDQGSRNSTTTSSINTNLLQSPNHGDSITIECYQQ